MKASRYRGTLLGVGLGDAVGAPFEGSPDVDPAAMRRWCEGEKPLRWTDDTHMTIGLAASLIERETVDGPHLAARFAAEHQREPWRGYGPGPPRIFAQLRAGATWDGPARALFGGEGSHGNGAAMRVAPVALLAPDDPVRVVALARDSARVTHAHELGMQGAALQARAIAHLLSGGPDGLVEAVRDAAPHPEYQQRLDRLAGVEGAEPADLARLTGTGIAAVEAVPAALAAFLARPHDFAEAVTTAVAMGGDTDTIAAMTGALSGAFLGENALPRHWLTRLEAADRLRGLADRLLALADPAARR